MREGIGGVVIFMLVIILILIFAGLMSLTINESNAFAVKDQLVSIIEDAGGLDTDVQCLGADNCNEDNKDQKTLQEIVDAIDANSYRQKGDCEVLEEKFKNNIGVKVQGYQRTGEHTMSGKKSSFCIVKIPANNSDPNSSGSLKGYYYQVYVFYQLDIPVLNSLFSFRSMGETKILYR